jgi:hypothetical protein
MNWLLLGILVAVALAMIAPAVQRKDYRLQFPCLAGLTVLFQIALPLASLNSVPDEISSDSLTRFSVMANLCLIASWAGYRSKVIPLSSTKIIYKPERLTQSAAILFAIGVFFTFKFNTTELEFDLEKAGMTGVGTIYLTLANVSRYGAVLAAILFLRTKNWKLLVFVVPQLWSYYLLFAGGRRSPTGEIIIIICILVWFFYRLAIPLWFMVFGVFMMALFSSNIGIIRATLGQPLHERVDKFKEASPLQKLTLKGMAEDRQYVEIYNAAKFMESRTIGGNYTLGLHFWNQLVFGFVPGQIVGKQIKESMMIKLVDDTKWTSFEKSVGTCETGIGEAFMAFWYCGCGLFFLIGAYMRWLWDSASRGSILHLYLLLLCSLGALLAFSNQIWTYVNMIVNIAIFSLPCFWWSAIHSQYIGRRRARVEASDLNKAKA